MVKNFSSGDGTEICNNHATSLAFQDATALASHLTRLALSIPRHSEEAMQHTLWPAIDFGLGRSSVFHRSMRSKP